MYKPFFTLVTSIALAIFVSLPVTSAKAQTDSIDPNTPVAPAWNLTDIRGRSLSSESFQGKVVILDFWATWCPPCRKEIPGLVALWKLYRKEGLVVIGVSLDQTGADTVRAFAKRFKMTYPVALGDQAIVQAYGGIDAIPTTFVIDRAGRVVSVHRGYTDQAEFEREIAPLIRSK